MKRFLAVAVLVLIVDLGLKTWFNSQLVLNSGSALGLPIDNRLIVLLHLGVILISWVSLARFKHKSNEDLLILFATIVSISNLGDRIILGGVRDYIYFLGIWFNLADAAIVSAIMLLVKEYIYGKSNSNQK
jgi:lipoprotein signal peptidase